MTTMLRITVRGVTDSLVLELEGCVAGPWVDELERSWRQVMEGLATGPVHVDLRSVCHVDARGRVLMTRMYRQGARFVASGCVMPEMIRELSAEAAASAEDARN
jgi:hypothetical protein